MEKQVKEFLEYVVNADELNRYELKEVAQRLLNADFQKAVRELWAWDIERGIGATKEKRASIKALTPAMFIAELKYDTEKLEFIDNNFSKIDLIILTIHEYIDEVDAKTKEGK